MIKLTSYLVVLEWRINIQLGNTLMNIFLIQRVITLKDMWQICFWLHRCETQQPQKVHPSSYKWTDVQILRCIFSPMLLEFTQL